MHRRTFLTGLFGVAAAGVGASLATRAEAFTLIPADGSAPKPDARSAAEAESERELSQQTAADGRIEPVQYRRRYYRRRVYRRPMRRWRPVRRRVCTVRRNRWGRVTRVCTWR